MLYMYRFGRFRYGMNTFCVLCVYIKLERERDRERRGEREREMDVDEPVDTYPIPASEDMHPVLFIDKNWAPNKIGCFTLNISNLNIIKLCQSLVFPSD